MFAHIDTRLQYEFDVNIGISRLVHRAGLPLVGVCGTNHRTGSHQNKITDKKEYIHIEKRFAAC